MTAAPHRLTQHDHTAASLTLAGSTGAGITGLSQGYRARDNHGLQGTGGYQSRPGGEELRNVIVKEREEPLADFLGIPEAVGSTPSHEGRQADTSPVYPQPSKLLSEGWGRQPSRMKGRFGGDLRLLTLALKRTCWSIPSRSHRAECCRRVEGSPLFLMHGLELLMVSSATSRNGR